MKKLIITILTMVVAVFAIGGKAMGQNPGDTIVVGAAGAQTFETVPDVSPNPIINAIVKIAVGLFTAVISHFLITLFKSKSSNLSV